MTTYEFFLQRAVKKRAANRGQQSNAARDEGIEMSGQSTFNSSDKERNSDDRLVDASAISYNQNRGEPWLQSNNLDWIGENWKLKEDNKYIDVSNILMAK